MNTVVLVSGVQHNDSDMYIHYSVMYIDSFSDSFPIQVVPVLVGYPF